MTTYKITHTFDENVLYQIRIGFWGSDKDIPTAFCPDFKSAIELHARPSNGRRSAKMTKDGRFYRKSDATAALNTLEKAALMGGMFLKGKNNEHPIYGFTGRVIDA